MGQEVGGREGSRRKSTDAVVASEPTGKQDQQPGKAVVMNSRLFNVAATRSFFHLNPCTLKI